MIAADDVKVCNCAGCGEELLGRAHEFRRDELPFPYRNMPGVRGRIHDRPYCGPCLAVAKGDLRGGRRAGRSPEEDNQGLHGPVKFLEG